MTASHISKILLMGTLLISFTQCRNKNQHQTEQTFSFHPQRTARVEAAPRELEVAGTVRAADVAELASRFGGFVRQVRVKAGTKVGKGELLVLLDDQNLQAQSSKVRHVENEVRQAMEEAAHHLQAAAAQKELAANTYNRIHSLYQKKSASKQEFEEAQSRKVAAEESWRSAQNKLAQVEARLRQVKSDLQEVGSSLSYQRIAAPFDGIVTTVNADEGAFMNPGQLLVTVENTSHYQMVFYLEQDFVPAVGTQIAIVIPSISVQQLQSVVEESSPSPDRGTKTYLVKSRIPNLKQLHSGVAGKVLLRISQTSLWIPKEFLKSQNDLETVYVRQEGVWQRVLVKSGRQSDNKVEILSGLNRGEEVGI